MRRPDMLLDVNTICCQGGFGVSVAAGRNRIASEIENALRALGPAQ